MNGTEPDRLLSVLPTRATWDTAVDELVAWRLACEAGSTALGRVLQLDTASDEHPCWTLASDAVDEIVLAETALAATAETLGSVRDGVTGSHPTQLGDSLELPEARLQFPPRPDPDAGNLLDRNLHDHYVACEAMSPAGRLKQLHTALTRELFANGHLHGDGTSPLRQGWFALGGTWAHTRDAGNRLRACRQSIPKRLAGYTVPLAGRRAQAAARGAASRPRPATQSSTTRR